MGQKTKELVKDQINLWVPDPVTCSPTMTFLYDNRRLMEKQDQGLGDTRNIEDLAATQNSQKIRRLSESLHFG